MEPLKSGSARWPEFLQRYSPAEGFSVQTEILDALSLNPGLMKLYEIALHGGHSPESLGLPPLLSREPALICRATLRDPHGCVLATATAAAPAGQAVEGLETAARQRLLAALGLGDDLVDVDEAPDQRDERDQGLTAPGVQAPLPGTETRAVAGADPAPATPVDEGGAMATSASPAREDPATTLSASAQAVAIAPVETPVDTPSRGAWGAATAATAEERALPLLQRQIAHLASLRGIAVPEVHTRAEGQAALKALMQQPAAVAVERRSGTTFGVPAD